MRSFEEQFRIFLEAAFREDLGEGDHSTLSCIPAESPGRAVLWLKQEGILAGLVIARKILEYQEPSAQFNPFKNDGDPIYPGERAFEVKASMHTLLQCERILLNCMQRMSGIATLTRAYADKIRGMGTRLLDTRKSTPNFRLLEKEAVRIGGGDNHRFGLYDMIMLKDNHIDYCGSIEQALERAWSYREDLRPALLIEVETRNLEEVKKALATGRADRIMMDNFSPDELKKALKLIGRRCQTEASGGITLDNIRDYAETGVDFISVGSLIHQARSLDMSLKAEMVYG